MNQLRTYVDVVDCAPSAILILQAPDLTILHSNKMAKKYFGDRAAISERVSETLPEFEHQGILDKAKSVLHEKTAITFRQKIIIAEDLVDITEKFFDFSVYPLSCGKKVVVQLLEVPPSKTDFGENRRETGSDSSLREDFLNIAAHELKTPITAISLCSQVLNSFIKRKIALPDPCEKAIMSLNNSILKLNYLARNMLDLTNPDEALVLNVQEVKIGDLAARVAEEVKLVAKGSDVKVEVSEDSNIANVDKYKMEQVITNLLVNAIKYGDGNPVCITISSNDCDVVIDVKDYGIGISDADKENIFDKYTRVPNSSIKGLGIGLYLVKRIVDSHNGKIEVSSSPGVGSTFSVKIPKKK